MAHRSLYLEHHGVKGMKWGVRRYQKTNKRKYLPKGSLVGRITIDSKDKTYDNKKYVSINSEDHGIWDKYFGKHYVDEKGWTTFSVMYKTTKDINVMSSAEQGKKYVELLKKKNFYNQSVKDLTAYYTKYPHLKSNNPEVQISQLISTQTKAGKDFVKKIIRKYDALEDTHGKNTAKNPLIVLNPDRKLQRVSMDYSDYVKNIYARHDGIG